MLRARGGFRCLALGRVRVNGFRFLSSAQPQEVDGSGSKEVDEAGLRSILIALDETTQKGEVLDEAMQPWKDSLGYKTVNKVLEQAGSASAALGFLGWACKQQFFKSGLGKIEAYKLLLRRLLDANMGSDVRRLIKETRESGCMLKRNEYLEMAAQLLKQKQSAEIIGIAQDSLETLQDNHQFVEGVVQKCCEAEEFGLATEILEMMASKVSNSDKPKLAADLLSATAEASNFSKVWVLLEKLSLNASDYLALIELLCKSKKLEQACFVVDKMTEAGHQPTAECYSQLMDAFVKCSKLPEALAMLQVMAEQGFKPPAATYERLVEVFCKEGALETACKLLKAMVHSGFMPSIEAFNRLMHGLCTDGKTEKARKLLNKMSSKGLVPDTVTYTSLINKLRKDDSKAALEVFEEMMYRGCVPDKPVFWSVFGGIGSDDRDAEARSQILEKYRSRFDLDCQMYSKLISIFGKAGKIEEVRRLFEEMVSKGIRPDLVTYNALVSALCENKMVDEALQVYRKLPERGFAADRLTYATLIGGLCDAGRVQEACALKETMIQNKGLPSRSCYQVLIDALLKAGLNTQARLMIQEHKRLRRSGRSSDETTGNDNEDKGAAEALDIIREAVVAVN